MREPPRGPLAGVMGALAARLYGAAVARRNRSWDRGVGVTRLDRPVISVGNLSVGGTGKTPIVRAVTGWLIDAGRRPCIAMRGYRAARDSQGVLRSDEADEYARTLPTWSDGTAVPIVVRADRAAGLRELFDREVGRRVDRVVLDDGFQHRRLARDLDIVLIDATRSPFDDRLLPAGWLREPVEGLRRARAIIVTHAEAVSAEALARLRSRLRGVVGDGASRQGSERGEVPIAVCRHRWSRVVGVDATGEREIGFDGLRGRRVLAVCAIGNPGAFFAMVRAAVDAGTDPSDRAAAASASSSDTAREKSSASTLVGEMALRDHDPYSSATIRRIADEALARRAEIVLTTEKDWSKLRDADRSAISVPVARASLEIVFDEGADEIRRRVVEA